jgi:putative DNA primase/helicase
MAQLQDAPQTLDIEAAATLPRTDAGNAEAFVEMFGDLVRYDHARRRWLVWDSHRWEPDTDGTVHRMALGAVRARLRAVADNHDLDGDTRKAIAKWAIGSESRSRLDALLALARTMKPIADDGRGWDTTPGVLGVPNGVVDLDTGELRDGQPEDRITMCAGIDYEPTAECPRWERFVAEVLSPLAEDGADDEVPELVAFVQSLAGYSLTAEANLDIVVFLMGVGSNGKTTLLSFFKEAAGEYAKELEATALKSTRFDRHSTEVADLELSRLATCEEIGDDKLNANRLKHLSGGGRVRARRMRENSFEFEPTWLIWLTTNGLPRTTDNSWAFWRRVLVLDFPHVFGKSDDPTLEDDLRRELPGILAWMVRGAVEFYANQKSLPEMPASVRAATQEYREDIDPLEGVFEAGVLVEDASATTTTADLHKAYVAWASVIEVPVDRRFGQDGFAKALSGRFNRCRIKSLPGDPRGFKGVRVGNLAALGTTADA